MVSLLDELTPRKGMEEKQELSLRFSTHQLTKIQKCQGRALLPRIGLGKL
jgi:hypothetical protein